MIRNFIGIVCAVVLLTGSVFSADAIDVSRFSIQHLTNTEGLCSQQIYSVKQTSDGAGYTTVSAASVISAASFSGKPGDFRMQAGDQTLMITCK